MSLIKHRNTKETACWKLLPTESKLYTLIVTNGKYPDDKYLKGICDYINSPLWQRRKVKGGLLHIAFIRANLYPDLFHTNKINFKMKMTIK